MVGMAFSPTFAANLRDRSITGRALKLRRCGRQDQVDVVGHEAIGAAGHPRLAQRRGHEGAIGAVILLGEKGLLPLVAALGDVMRQARHHHARAISHGPKRLTPPASLSIKYRVPRFTDLDFRFMILQILSQISCPQISQI
jgi:hypothetical protein